MKIEGEGIRPFDPLPLPSVPVGKDRSSADGAVDVKPKLLLKGKIRQCIQGIEGTGTDSTGVADHTDRLQPTLPISRDGFLQIRQVDPSGHQPWYPSSHAQARGNYPIPQDRAWARARRRASCEPRYKNDQLISLSAALLGDSP